MYAFSSYPDSMPYITSKAWSVINGLTGEIYYSKNEFERREIASLTKIMTAYVCIKLIEKLDINITQTKIEVPLEAALIEGTTADLYEGDLLSLKDMLHAMMLPSGNDAAISLANFFGEVIQRFLQPVTFPNKMVNSIKIFVEEMNKIAKELDMTQTNYANPHGLQHYMNKSTCSDIGKLCIASMKKPLFRELISKQKYECEGQNALGNDKLFYWRNTNRMLYYGYNGIKTGYTPTAGPCLVTSYEQKDVMLFIILLDCKSMDARWQETMKLTRWAIGRLSDICSKSKVLSKKPNTSIIAAA